MDVVVVVRGVDRVIPVDVAVDWTLKWCSVVQLAVEVRGCLHLKKERHRQAQPSLLIKVGCGG